MGKQAPRKVYRYSDDFKAQAVRLSELPGSKCKKWPKRLPFIPSCCLVGVSKYEKE